MTASSVSCAHQPGHQVSQVAIVQCELVVAGLLYLATPRMPAVYAHSAQADVYSERGLAQGV